MPFQFAQALAAQRVEELLAESEGGGRAQRAANPKVERSRIEDFAQRKNAPLLVPGTT